MKISAVVNQPIGMVSYSPSRKEWIMSALSVGAGLASSLLGGNQAAKAAKAAEARQRREEAREGATYTRRYNERWIDQETGQNTVRKAKQIYDRQLKQAAGAKAVAGGTDAKEQMAKDSSNRAVADVIANGEAMNAMRRDKLDAQHEQAQQRFAQMDMNREMQRAQNITNAAQSASNAIMQAGAAIDQASVKPTNLQGGYNNGKDITQIDADMGVTPYNGTRTFDGNSVIPAGQMSQREYDKLFG